MLRKIKEPALLLAIALLILLPGAIFSRLHVTDGFLYQVIAYLELTKDSNNIVPFLTEGYSFRFIEYLIGYPMILSIFSRLIPIPPQQLQYIPLAAVFVPTGFFVLTYKLTRSIKYASLLALYGAYDIGLASHYNVFAYVWSNLLFFAFLIFYLNWIELNRKRDLIIVTFIFLGSLFLHYAATIWMMVFVVSINLFHWIRLFSYRLRNRPLDIRPSFSLGIAFMALFLTYNTIFYKVWLPGVIFSASGSANPFLSATEKIASFMSGQAAATQTYRYIHTWGSGYGPARLLQIVLIVFPVLLWIFLSLTRQQYRDTLIQIQYMPSFLFACGVMLIADWAIYGLHSGFTFRLLSLIVPFLTVVSLIQLRAPSRLTTFYVIGILFASVVASFYVFKYYYENPNTSYEDVWHGSSWFYKYYDGGYILSDLDIFGLYLVEASEQGGHIPLQDYYYYETINGLLGKESQDNIFSYVVIDSSHLYKPLHGYSNAMFTPIAFLRFEIEKNWSFDKMYDDGNNWILIRR